VEEEEETGKAEGMETEQDTKRGIPPGF